MSFVCDIFDHMKINEIMKYGVLGGILAILFVPFIVADHQFFPFITGKGFVFRIGIEIIFAVWVMLALRDRSYLPKFSWITGAVLIFFGVIALADIFGENPYKSFWSNYERMEGLISLIHFLLYYFVVSSVFKTDKLWKIFLNVSVVSSVIMAVYGFFQLAGKLVINQGGVRVDGTFGNASYLAVYMLVNMFFAAFLFLRTKENIYLKVSYAIAFIMQGTILYHTATRGAILGVIGGIAVSALLIAIFSKGNKAARIGSIGTLVVILAIVGSVFAIRNTDFAKSSQTLGRFTSINAESIKSQGRYFVWQMAWEGFKERPILGWGQENFNYVFNKNYDPKMYTQEQWFDRTHDIFLDWLIAGGALGLLSYLALYVALLLYLWRGKNSFSLTDKSIITGFIAGYVFQNVFVFDNLVSYILFFTVLAFVHAMSTTDRESVRWLSKISSNPEIAERIAMPIVLLALAISMYFGNIKPILANRALIGAVDYGKSTPQQSLENFKKVFTYNTFGSSEAREQFLTAIPRFSTPNIPVEVKNEFYKLAKDQLIIQVNETPNDTRYLLFTGNVLTQLGEYKEALTYLERARETSPGKQNIYFAIGAAEISIGPSEFAKALAAFKTAYDLEPSYTEAKMIYAIGAIYNKDYKLGGELLRDLDPKEVLFDDRVLSAYYVTGNLPEVLSILQARIKIDPKDTQSYFRLAAAYLQAGDRSKSIEQLKKAEQIDPNVKQQADYLISEIQAGRNPIK